LAGCRSSWRIAGIDVEEMGAGVKTEAAKSGAETAKKLEAAK
jgi:hypothetical protein